MTSRAKISPFRHRIAAAVSTPSGAPPVPITAWTPLPDTAAAMPADRSPSPMRRMRAPVARMSAISFSWRGRSSTTTVSSSTCRPSARGDRPQVLAHRRVDVDEVLGAGADDQLLHVEIGRVQQAAFVGRGQHRDGIGRAGGAQVRALERIDGDVDLVVGAALAVALAGQADLLADEEHRRLVALTLADDDGAVDRHRVELAPHRFDGRLIRAVAIALPHRVGTGDGRLFDDAQELEGEVGFHGGTLCRALPGVGHGVRLRPFAGLVVPRQLCAGQRLTDDRSWYHSGGRPSCTRAPGPSPSRAAALPPLTAISR